MSLFGAMTSGVSGLTAQSSAMGAIADNITNVNTIGYKNTKTDFQTLVTKQTSVTNYSAGGVQARPLQQNDVQGLLQSTSSQTDIAISGNGMFVVNESNNPSLNSEFLFTRAGSFYQDDEGFLRNAAGYYLQGWPTDPQGNVSLPTGSNAGATNQNIISTDFLETVNLSRIGSTAASTTNIGIGANLPSSAAVGDTHDVDVQFYDSLGTTNAISLEYTKSATNQWDLTVNPPSGTSVVNLYSDAGAPNDLYQSIGQLEFNSLPTAIETLSVGANTYAVGPGAADFDTSAAPLNTVAGLVSAIETQLIADLGATPFSAQAQGTTLRLIGNNTGGTASLAVSATNMDTFLVQQNAFTVLEPTASAPAVQFNADGTPQSFGVSEIEVLDFVNGAANLNGTDRISLNMGETGLASGMTQFANDFTPNFIQQDGARFGTFSGVTISEDGMVTALFDNGELRPVYKLPVATFTNPNGLESRTGNVWHATDASGNPTLRTADNGPAGQIVQASLEASTVDIGEEFADMIMVQRAYSAATKIISTADEMLEELVRVKR